MTDRAKTAFELEQQLLRALHRPRPVMVLTDSGPVPVSDYLAARPQPRPVVIHVDGSGKEVG